MKKNKLILAAIISTLLFSSCNDFIDSYEYGKVSGTLTISGAIPEEYAKILSQNTDLSKTTAGRAAFPSRPDLTSSSYTKKIIAVNQKKTSETVEAEFDQDTGAFTVNNLRFGVPYKIKANITSGTTEIFSGESKSFTLTSTNSVIPDICVELDPVQSQNGTGAVKLSVTTNTIEIKKIRATVFTNVDRWTTNGAPDNFEVEASNGQNGFVTEVIDVNDILSGTYIIRFDFLSENANSVPRYTTYQNINVFDGLITNRWSGNDECIDSSETRTRLYVTGELCEKFGKIKDFYVGGKNASDTNSGSKNAPLETIERAFSRMDDSNADYTITISTDITKSTVIDFNQISARSIIIRGAEEKDIKLSAGGNGTNLIFNTPDNIQITIEKLTITGGYSDIGGGVRIIGSSNIVFGKDCVVTGNKAENEGAGVYICGNSSEVYPTLTIQAGAKITNNHNFIAKGNAGLDAVGLGVYAENYAKVVMTGGEISGNSAVKVGGNMGHVQGGGVYVCSNGSFEMSGGKIYDNEVTVHEASGAGGGAAYVDSTGNFKISGSAVIPYGITTTDGTEKGEGKNDIMLQNIKDSGTWKQATIQVGTLTGNGTVATITTQTWRRGSPILSGSGLTDAIVERFELSDSDWEKNITDSSSKVRIDSPIYVASTGTRNVCTGAPSDTSGRGTKSAPYQSLSKAFTELTDSSCDYKIYVDGVVNNTTGELGSSCAVASLSIEGATSTAGNNVLNGGNGTDSSYSTSSVVAIGKNIPVTIKNLTIRKGSAENGGGLNVSAGIITLNNVVVTDCKADKGGGIYVGSSGKLDLKNSVQITSNTFKTSSCDGAGLYNLGSVSSYDGYFATNKAGTAGNGGAIFNAASASFYIGGKSTVSQNEAKIGGGIFNGGNLYIGYTYQFTGENPGQKQASFNNSSGNIYKNTASGNGGGIYNSGTVDMRNGMIGSSSGALYKNSAANGGGVFMVSGSFTMTDGSIRGNTATDTSGGGVYMNAGIFTLKGSASILDNSASSGGGVYLFEGTFDMQGGSIGSSTKPNSCSATGNGAGVLVRASNDAIFKMSGGAVVVKENEVYLEGTSVSSITIPGNLEGTAPVATIKLPSYAANRQVLGGEKVSDNYKKFALATTGYYIDSNGFVQEGYFAETPADLESVINSISAGTTTAKIVVNGGTVTEDALSNMRSAFTQLYESYSTGTMVTIDLSKTTFSDNKVPDSAFSNCINLAGVSLPTSIASIGKNAFYLTNLSSISIPSNVTSIGDGAFQGCPLGDVTIPNDSKLVSIGDNAFSSTNIMSINIPSSVTSIGKAAFKQATMLLSVTLPENLTSLGAGAFMGCSGLTSFTVPSKITSIPATLLSGCTRITTITIKGKITSIGAGAFRSCKSVTNINYKDNSQCTETQWKSIDFGSEWRGTGANPLPITATVTFYDGTSKTLEALGTE